MRLCDAFRFRFLCRTYYMLPLLLLRQGLWRWDAWLGRYLAKRVCIVGRSALVEVRLVLGVENCAQAVSRYAYGTI